MWPRPIGVGLSGYYCENDSVKMVQFPFAGELRLPTTRTIGAVTADLERFLREHISARRFVQVAAECEVVYVGRAASLTEAGDYVVLLKADGSVQVHGARGE